MGWKISKAKVTVNNICKLQNLTIWSAVRIICYVISPKALRLTKSSMIVSTMPGMVKSVLYMFELAILRKLSSSLVRKFLFVRFQHYFNKKTSLLSCHFIVRLWYNFHFLQRRFFVAIYLGNFWWELIPIEITFINHIFAFSDQLYFHH